MNLQPQPPQMPQPMRLRFSVDEYYRMIDLGLISDYEKAEIIDGELIVKMTIGNRHAQKVDLLNRFFVKNVSDDIRVRIQNPLRISDYHEPEPDVVLADLTKYDGDRHPRADEVILLVEVADVSLSFDKNKKLPLYAEAEIPEVWIVNLIDNIIEVHYGPGNGLYQSTNYFNRGETLLSEAMPTLRLNVDEILD